MKRPLAEEEEYMELCYTVDTAKLAYQSDREGHQAEPPAVVRPPKSSRRPYESPLYRAVYLPKDAMDVAKEIDSQSRRVVQVNDVNFELLGTFS